MELWIPYGETEIPIRVPDDNFYKVLEPKKPPAVPQLENQIEDSLSNPVDGFQLSNLVKSGISAGILFDPILPNDVVKRTLEILKTRLATQGCDKIKIFSRIRTSNIEPPIPQDETGPFAFNPADQPFIELGKTPQGTDVSIEAEFLNCDVKITLGLVTPHFASGFTGGPDLLLPGASSLDTITMNRSLMVKAVPIPGAANENLVLADSLDAYKMAGAMFTLTFVPDGWGGVDSVFSGELADGFAAATTKYSEVHSPKLDRKSDIVVVAAGKLLGMDLYHGVRVLSNAFGAVKKDGTIVLVAECSRGVGDQGFLEYSKRFSEKKELLTELRRRFKLGGHVSLYLQDALERHRIQLVSVLPDLYSRDCFKLKPSRTASGAIQQAIRIEGKDAKILIVTRGDLTIPKVMPGLGG